VGCGWLAWNSFGFKTAPGWAAPARGRYVGQMVRAQKDGEERGRNRRRPGGAAPLGADGRRRPGSVRSAAVVRRAVGVAAGRQNLRVVGGGHGPLRVTPGSEGTNSGARVGLRGGIIAFSDAHGAERAQQGGQELPHGRLLGSGTSVLRSVGRLTGWRRAAAQTQNVPRERSRERRNRFMTRLAGFVAASRWGRPRRPPHLPSSATAHPIARSAPQRRGAAAPANALLARTAAIGS
jgi:hypothetical protein